MWRRRTLSTESIINSLTHDTNVAYVHILHFFIINCVIQHFCQHIVSLSLNQAKKISLIVKKQTIGVFELMQILLIFE
jgi:hypothetical protein